MGWERSDMADGPPELIRRAGDDGNAFALTGPSRRQAER